MSQDRNLNISDLLSNLRQEGEHVSTGDFTIDASKAEDKLKEYQLSNPNFFILKLVQSAVLAGATKVKVECQAHQVSLEHDGLPPTPSELKELLNYLFIADDAKERELHALKRLASGVNTAVATQARLLSVKCQSSGRAYQQDWSSEGAAFKDLGESEGEGLKFILKRKAREVASSLSHVGNTHFLDLAQGNRSSMQKEEAALWDRCIYAPIPIEMNGQVINRKHFGKARYPGYEVGSQNSVPLFFWLKNRHQYSNRYCHDRFHLIQGYYPKHTEGLANLIAPEHSHSALISEKNGHQAGQRCKFIIGIESSMYLPNRVNYISDGVLIGQESPNFPVLGVFALVCVQDFKTDLSGFSLIQNQDYDKMKRQLLFEVTELLKEAKSRSAELVKPLRRKIPASI